MKTIGKWLVALVMISGVAFGGEKEDCDILFKQIEARHASLVKTRQDLMDKLNEVTAFRNSYQAFLPMIPQHMRPQALDYDAAAARQLLFAQYGFSNNLYVQNPIDDVVIDVTFSILIADNHYRAGRYRNTLDELVYSNTRLTAAEIVAFDVWFKLTNAEWNSESVVFIISMTVLNPAPVPMPAPVPVPPTVAGGGMPMVPPVPMGGGLVPPVTPPGM